MKQAIEKTKQRMNEMRQIKAGWNDGSGEAIPNTLIDDAEKIIIKLIEAGIPKPLIGPTVDDTGISIEWHTDEWIVGAEFIVDEKMVEFMAVSQYYVDAIELDINDNKFIRDAVIFLIKHSVPTGLEIIK